jgi:hypothetical protein
VEQKHEPRICRAEEAGAFQVLQPSSSLPLSPLFPSPLSIGELQGGSCYSRRLVISPACAAPSCFPHDFPCTRNSLSFSRRTHRSVHFSLCLQPPCRSSGVSPMPWRCHTQGGHSRHDTSIGKAPRRRLNNHAFEQGNQN